MTYIVFLILIRSIRGTSYVRVTSENRTYRGNAWNSYIHRSLRKDFLTSLL